MADAPTVPSVESWIATYDEAFGRMAELIDTGSWVQGPESLMRVLGAHRSEVHHSRALAWLLDPYGTHRLGPRFLHGFLDLAGQPSASFAPAGTTVRLEVPTWDVVDRQAGSIDVTIECGPSLVVIENKWHAAETNNQLLRYWRGTGGRATYVFLTLDGAAPLQAGESTAAWKCLSWRGQVWPLLSELVAAHPEEDQAPLALQDYIESLREVFG